VPYEGFSELHPAIDPLLREVLETGSRRVSKVHWDALVDEQVVTRPTVAAREIVVLEPYTWVGLSVVLGNHDQGIVTSRRDGYEQVCTEGPWTSGVKRRDPALIFVTIVVASMHLVVLPLRSAFTPIVVTSQGQPVSRDRASFAFTRVKRIF
jgi:hypothetical protein